jgi:hypothetical protein
MRGDRSREISRDSRRARARAKVETEAGGARERPASDKHNCSQNSKRKLHIKDQSLQMKQQQCHENNGSALKVVQEEEEVQPAELLTVQAKIKTGWLAVQNC